MKILICDNDTISVRVLEFQFVRDGFEIFKTSNGRDAKKMMANYKDIDMLITDIYMPYINGLELITYVRKTLQLDIPIVVISRINHEETILYAFELGADSYITKPFKSEDISHRVKHLMNYEYSK